MARLKYPLVLIFALFVFSCKNEQRNIYAIKDFRKPLQPLLSDIVSEGIVTYHPGVKKITDTELAQLIKAENPILRATAFGEMLERSFFNHFDIVMDHLDDTAIIAADYGEFGIRFETVSDYLIKKSNWETVQERSKTIEKVLTRHNYLSSAYRILTNIEAQEKYYPFIKNMATRPRQLDPYDGYELNFREIEFALYGLAKFKKQEDVGTIKNKLMEHDWELSDISFKLMEEFPDTAYFDVLQAYHRKKFYKFSGNRPYGFTGFNADKAAPEDFIRALTVQKSDRSAKLLDTLLTYLPKYTCMPDKENIISEVIMQIWEHPCSAYNRLRDKIRDRAEKMVKERVYMQVDTLPNDKSKNEVGWFSAVQGH